ncbi:cytochrome c, class I NosC [Pseudogulbenkiania sp. NH8B]|uniref:c-type cytochrome n=1 Tax=Pseudogulbenkiania sp. (strain NH8B) TaxID=748280 RepID=UPI000227A716|nr:c-type cytochrome [Pseudogulbenkiania sp. NH8B]BAK78382.1 cytochrome c, class I NosC [Pseudogulbenkiania sp. NH8B]
MINAKWIVACCVLPLALSACGKSEGKAAEAGNAAPAAVASAPAAATAVSSAASVSNAGGEKVFKSVCSMCHQTGAAGAPMVGSKEDWAPRIAQGKDTLYKHALEGFTGQKGAMPAHGGNPSLSDAEVKSAVDYMVSKAS